MDGILLSDFLDMMICIMDDIEMPDLNFNGFNSQTLCFSLIFLNEFDFCYKCF